MAASNPIVCGRKFCSGCGRWRLIVDFPARTREPALKLQGRCHACTRAYQKAWKASLLPAVREQRRARDRERVRRHSPEQRKARLENARRWRQREGEAYYARAAQRWREMMADPKRAEEVRANRRMNYRLKAMREGRAVREIREETYANGNGKAKLNGRRTFPTGPIAAVILEWMGELGGVPLGNANSVYGAGFLQLAELCGLPDRTLRAICFERPTVQYATLDVICTALDTPIASLYPEA